MNVQDVSKVRAALKKPSTSSQNIPKIMKQGNLTPWLYLLPALVLMSFFIIYPMITTIGLFLRTITMLSLPSLTSVLPEPFGRVSGSHPMATTSRG